MSQNPKYNCLNMALLKLLRSFGPKGAKFLLDIQQCRMTLAASQACQITTRPGAEGFWVERLPLNHLNFNKKNPTGLGVWFQVLGPYDAEGFRM